MLITWRLDHRHPYVEESEPAEMLEEEGERNEEKEEYGRDRTEEMRLRIGADRMGVSVYACAALNEEGR